jgi:ubiquinone/menaquinone biosynthesis C-methylase UbiE
MSMSAAGAIYNTIGKSYNVTRKADPYIADRVYRLLEARPGGDYLDIGCGTCNYLAVMESYGLNMTGIDPSETMLDAARSRGLSARLIRAGAESIPLPDDSCDGAIAMLTVHHWNDLATGLEQLHRVVKKGGKVVFFTYTPEQVRGYWLAHYFPEMIGQGASGIPSFEKMKALLELAGFGAIQAFPYFVTDDLQDKMMYAYKLQPEKYLEEEVRRNTSGFALANNQEEIASGLRLLSQDIASGRIRQVMAQYENEFGDYLFITAVNSD